MAEAVLTDFPDAVTDVYQQLMQRLGNRVLILYGHSLGSALAFGVAGMLEAAGRPADYLLVSGNPGPGVREPTFRYLMNREDFLQELRQLGGIPDAFFQDKDLIDFFEPIMRADFELAERNDLAASKPLYTPVYALMGNQEQGAVHIENWHKFTTARFDHELLEGDHFFIHRHPQRLAGIIRLCCSRTKQINHPC